MERRKARRTEKACAALPKTGFENPLTPPQRRIAELFETARTRIRNLCISGAISAALGRPAGWVVSELMNPGRLILHWEADEAFPVWIVVNDAYGGETERFSLPVRLEGETWWWRDPETGFDKEWKYLLYRTMAFSWPFPKGG
jgi:hypothetical protein